MVANRFFLVVEPLLSWEEALTMVSLTGLLLIPYVGQVVLVGLAGVAIYDLLKNVTHLFREYYDRAVGATSWSELRSAGKVFAQAVVGGLLDVLGIFVGATALARLRALRVAGKLTVGTWVALVEEQAQALRVRLRGGIKTFSEFVKEKLPQQKPQAKPTLVPPKPKPKGIPRRKRKNSTKTRKQRAQANAADIDNQRGPQSHTRGKHGTQVTPQQHEDRIRTGRNPETGQIDLYPNGNPNRPRNSSGFDTDEKHLEALGKADAALDEGLANGTLAPDQHGKIPVTVDVKDVGTSYSLDPPNDYTHGRVVTTKVHKVIAYYKLDPATGRYKLITLYPKP